MKPTRSRTRRQTAFLESLKKIYYQLDNWYGANPNESHGEIGEARKRRSGVDGAGLARLVNGRDIVLQIEASKWEQCGCEMEFKEYEEGICSWSAVACATSGDDQCAVQNL